MVIEGHATAFMLKAMGKCHLILTITGLSYRAIYQLDYATKIMGMIYPSNIFRVGFHDISINHRYARW